MKGIHDLPVEILLRIFLKGCEGDEIQIARSSYLFAPCIKRRKKLSAQARLVCSRWRHLIDLPFKSNSRLWIARLQLQMDGQYNAMPSRIAKFQEELSMCQNCDIVIRLAVEGNRETLWRSINEIPEDTAAATRLFFYGMNLVFPFREQIVALQAWLPQPQLASHLFHSLMDSSKDSELVSLEINFASSYERIGDAREAPIDVYRFPSVPDLSELKQVAVIPKFIDLTRLQNLDDIKVASVSWLRDLHLPSGVRRLEVHKPVDVANLLRDISSKPILSNSLTHLTLSGLEEHTSPSPSLDLPKANFPHLLKLSVLKGSDTWMNRLFWQITTPRLEAVDIQLEGAGIIPSRLPSLLSSSTTHIVGYSLSWILMTTSFRTLLSPVLISILQQLTACPLELLSISHVIKGESWLDELEDGEDFVSDNVDNHLGQLIFCGREVWMCKLSPKKSKDPIFILNRYPDN